MPEEKICPVVNAYLRYTKAYWHGVHDLVREAYDMQFEQLHELRDNPNALIRDPMTRRLRAFYCLHSLFLLVRPVDTLTKELPLTREGIQSLTKFCIEARDAAEVRLYANQISGATGTVQLRSLDVQRVVLLTDIIVDAAEYLRPRLATAGPLAGMGRFFAKGLKAAGASSDRFIQSGRELLNVTASNRGDLRP